ncbi:MAG: PrkA family serine protein kinase [Deltaproteobacteria bacterium]
MEARRFLSSLGSDVKSSFVQSRTILSFDQYLDLVAQDPARHARNASQYLRDVFDHYGADELPTPTGKFRRFRLFDCPFSDGEGRVAGQEEVQASLYRILGNFVRTGRIDKLILLHGPNGSAKSSLVGAIQAAVEAYSHKPEGALYRFNWIFPSEKLAKGSIGFGDRLPGEPAGELPSFAQLEGASIDARLFCEVKDHPLFLLPRPERRKFLEKLLGPGALRGAAEASRQGAGSDGFLLSDYLENGDLCQKCRQIYGALLGAYQGDYLRVLRHVQVERFYASPRYQVALATIEPQLSVDAAYRQVTADRSHGSLPPALQNVALFEPSGPLASGNRGIVAYSDLLKRPLEHFKYLLSMSETGQVSIDHFSLYLDTVLIASSNEKHLSAFKETPDFASFKGRIELVRVPYLRRRRVEQEIYDQQLARSNPGRHVAPHATEVAATWGVLTRLKKPIPERYGGELRDIVDDLSPHEKLELYDDGAVPDRLAMSQAKELRKHAEALWRESDAYPNYEGRAGASPRELKTAISNALQHPSYRCLTPEAVLEELVAICRDKSVYEFLQQEVVDGFHDHEELVRVVEQQVLGALDEEIRDSMGLVSEAQYRDIFERYVLHVSHWVKGEKLRNRVTGEFEPPDESRMTDMEAIFMPEDEDRADFRRGLIAAIGAFRLDNPDSEVIEYARIFPDQFRRLRDHYFEEHKKQLRKNKENVLQFLAGDRGGMSPRELSQVEKMLATMTERYHYCQSCAKDAILFLLRKRYAD